MIRLCFSTAGAPSRPRVSYASNNEAARYRSGAPCAKPLLWRVCKACSRASQVFESRSRLTSRVNGCGMYTNRYLPDDHAHTLTCVLSLSRLLAPGRGLGHHTAAARSTPAPRAKPRPRAPRGCGAIGDSFRRRGIRQAEDHCAGIFDRSFFPLSLLPSDSSGAAAYPQPSDEWFLSSGAAACPQPSDEWFLSFHQAESTALAI